MPLLPLIAQTLRTFPDDFAISSFCLETIKNIDGHFTFNDAVLDGIQSQMTKCNFSEEETNQINSFSRAHFGYNRWEASESSWPNRLLGAGTSAGIGAIYGSLRWVAQYGPNNMAETLAVRAPMAAVGAASIYTIFRGWNELMQQTKWETIELTEKTGKEYGGFLTGTAAYAATGLTVWATSAIAPYTIAPALVFPMVDRYRSADRDDLFDRLNRYAPKDSVFVTYSKKPRDSESSFVVSQ